MEPNTPPSTSQPGQNQSLHQPQPSRPLPIPIPSRIPMPPRTDSAQLLSRRNEEAQSQFAYGSKPQKMTERQGATDAGAQKIREMIEGRQHHSTEEAHESLVSAQNPTGATCSEGSQHAEPTSPCVPFTRLVPCEKLDCSNSNCECRTEIPKRTVEAHGAHHPRESLDELIAHAHERQRRISHIPSEHDLLPSDPNAAQPLSSSEEEGTQDPLGNALDSTQTRSKECSLHRRTMSSSCAASCDKQQRQLQHSPSTGLSFMLEPIRHASAKPRSSFSQQNIFQHAPEWQHQGGEQGRSVSTAGLATQLHTQQPVGEKVISPPSPVHASMSNASLSTQASTAVTTSKPRALSLSTTIRAIGAETFLPPSPPAAEQVKEQHDGDESPFQSHAFARRWLRRFKGDGNQHAASPDSSESSSSSGDDDFLQYSQLGNGSGKRGRRGTASSITIFSSSSTPLRGESDLPSSPQKGRRRISSICEEALRPFQVAPVSESHEVTTSSSKRRSSSISVHIAAMQESREEKEEPALQPARQHAQYDDEVLLPFLERPVEIRELLFGDGVPPGNKTLSQRLHYLYPITVPEGGSGNLLPGSPWSGLCDVLFAPRELLGDHEWLATLRSMLSAKSEEVWAKFERVVGADLIRDFDHAKQHTHRRHHLRRSSSSASSLSVHLLREVPEGWTLPLQQVSGTHETYAEDEYCPSDTEGYVAAVKITACEDYGEVQEHREQTSMSYFDRPISSASAQQPASVLNDTPLAEAHPQPRNREDPIATPRAEDQPHPQLSSPQLAGRMKHVEGEQAQADPSRKRRESFALSFNDFAQSTQHSEEITPASLHAHRRAHRRHRHHHRSSDASSGSSDVCGMEHSGNISKLAHPHGPSQAGGSRSSHKTHDESTSAQPRRDRSSSQPRRSSSGSNSPSFRNDSGNVFEGLMADGRTRHPSVSSAGSESLKAHVECFRRQHRLSDAKSPGEIPAQGPAAKGEERTEKKEEVKVAQTIAAERKEPELPTVQLQQKAGGSSGFALGGGYSLRNAAGINFKQPASESGGSVPGAGVEVSSSMSSPSQPFSPVIPSIAPVGRASGARVPRIYRRSGGFAAFSSEYMAARRRRTHSSASLLSDAAFSTGSQAIASSDGSTLADDDLRSPSANLRVEVHGNAPSISDLSSPISPGFHQAGTDEDRAPGLNSLGLRGFEWNAPHHRPAHGPLAHSTHLPPLPESEVAENMSEILPAESINPNFADSPAQRVRSYSFATDTAPHESAPSSATASPFTPATTALPSPASLAGEVPQFSPTGSHASHEVCTIIFPVPPSTQFSRAADLSARLSHASNTAVLDQVKAVCGEDTLQQVIIALSTVERSELNDLGLLEQVAHNMGLVDLDRACSVRERKEAEDALLDDQYEKRWKAFEALAFALGLTMRDVCEAKQRCGPPGTLCVGPACKR